MPKIRVLVVDDAVVMRRMISEALGRDPDLEVVGTAAHGRIALAKIPQVNPDAITLDIEMPEMDGIATLKAVRILYPKLPVIMFSTLSVRGATATLDALEAGASDYVTKPANVGSIVEGLERLSSELVPKIKQLCRRSESLAVRPAPVDAARAGAAFSSKTPRGAQRPVELVCVGTSTGGPNALAEVFGALSNGLTVPMVIVQHMPVLFTRMLAERLDKIGGMRCVEGEEGQRLEAGCAYVAPGGKHMHVYRAGVGLKLRLSEEPPENSCRPAVDVLFRSVAEACGGATLAVVMTGMGQDGLNGCRHIWEKGGRILAQDEASSVVWGMPGFVVRSELADRVLPVSEIGREIEHGVNASRLRSRVLSPGPVPA